MTSAQTPWSTPSGWSTTSRRVPPWAGSTLSSSRSTSGMSSRQRVDHPALDVSLGTHRDDLLRRRPPAHEKGGFVTHLPSPPFFVPSRDVHDSTGRPPPSGARRSGRDRQAPLRRPRSRPGRRGACCPSRPGPRPRPARPCRPARAPRSASRTDEAGGPPPSCPNASRSRTSSALQSTPGDVRSTASTTSARSPAVHRASGRARLNPRLIPRIRSPARRNPCTHAIIAATAERTCSPQ